MFMVELADYLTGGFVGGVTGNGGELFIEGVGNVFRGSEDFGTKGNGLVRWRGRVFTRKGFKKGPVFGRVGGV
jgi:hypothetical protein